MKVSTRPMPLNPALAERINKLETDIRNDKFFHLQGILSVYNTVDGGHLEEIAHEMTHGIKPQMAFGSPVPVIRKFAGRIDRVYPQLLMFWHGANSLANVVSNQNGPSGGYFKVLENESDNDELRRILQEIGEIAHELRSYSDAIKRECYEEFMD